MAFEQQGVANRYFEEIEELEMRSARCVLCASSPAHPFLHPLPLWPSSMITKAIQKTCIIGHECRLEDSPRSLGRSGF